MRKYTKKMRFKNIPGWLAAWGLLLGWFAMIGVHHNEKHRKECKDQKNLEWVSLKKLNKLLMDIIHETEEAECQAPLRGASVAKRLSWLTVQGRECEIKTDIECWLSQQKRPGWLAETKIHDEYGEGDESNLSKFQTSDPWESKPDYILCQCFSNVHDFP